MFEYSSMNFIFLGWLCLVILSCFVVFFDVRNRFISNKVCGAMIFVSIFIVAVNSERMVGANNLLASVFLFFLYVLSFWGGGDTKLAIAFLPAISEQYILLYLIGIGLLGGVLLAIYLFFGLQQGFDKIKKYGLPFGIPICISGLLCVAASL